MTHLHLDIECKVWDIENFFKVKQNLHTLLATEIFTFTPKRNLAFFLTKMIAQKTRIIYSDMYINTWKQIQILIKIFGKILIKIFGGKGQKYLAEF